jgi:hypothetical protein
MAGFYIYRMLKIFHSVFCGNYFYEPGCITAIKLFFRRTLVHSVLRAAKEIKFSPEQLLALT